jgi:hypothetical protein
MGQFKDAQGRTWDVEVNGGTIKRCLKNLGVDWGKPMGEPGRKADDDLPPLLRYCEDVAFMVDTLWLVCLPQANQRGVNDEAFGELLGGEALAEASAAFLDGLTDFFRQIGRTEIPAVIATQRRIVSESVAAVTSALEHEEVNALIDREVATLGRSCADLLRSPAESRPSATPTPN